MPSVCFYFQVHQPYRLRRYSVFDTDRHYFDNFRNAEICRKIAGRCYLPANRVLLDAIRMHQGRFRVAFSMSGVVLDQFREYAPEVLESFQELGKTGCVEFLDETYYHSLSFLYSREEFRAGRAASRPDPGAVRPAAARLSQYRADLQRRPGSFHQSYGI